MSKISNFLVAVTQETARLFVHELEVDILKICVSTLDSFVEHLDAEVDNF